MFGSVSFGNQTTTPSLFGSGTTTSAAPTFGFGSLGATPAATTGLGGFGASTLAPTNTSTFGSFGASTGLSQNKGAGLFGQTNQPTTATAQPAASILDQMVAAIRNPQIFNDERDTILAKWNQIQAFWGTGKGCYSQSGAVDFRPDNPYCRFKAVGYSCMPRSRNEDGLVSMTIAQPHADVRKVQQQFLDALQKIMGGQPTLSVCVQGLKPLPDNQTELIIYVLERPTSGPSRKVPASDLISAFSQTNVKTQLTTLLKVIEILPKTGMTPEQLKHYLDLPPSGIHRYLWDQAKLDNPAPERLIPVPMIGFVQLNQRLQHQEQQTKLHQNRLDMIGEELSKCQIHQTNMMSKLEEYKHKQLELGHRVLKVIVKQEVARKLGYAVQADEEQLKSHLEAMQTELSHPTQFRGRLNELMSQMRMQCQGSGVRNEVTYQMDASIQTEIRQLLKQQQQGLQHLISVINEDTANLKTIEQEVGTSAH